MPAIFATVSAMLAGLSFNFDDRCHAYDAPTTLSGIVVSAEFPGRPNFTSIRKGDEAERVFLLVLDKPTCAANEDGSDGEVFSAIQIVCPAIAGEQAAFTGTLSHAETAHHHTGAMLWCRKD